MAKPPFGLYIHVPFCATRCGYCDFNTYTPGELGSATSPAQYLDALEQELAMAQTQPVSSIFIGGGTPSMLGWEGLARILGMIKREVGIQPGAEITTESNPESTSPEFFHQLRQAGFTRISLGMQSASSRVLEILGRAHTPGRAFEAATEAKAAGFDHVNLDMIYGTPYEHDEDVAHTLDRVLETGVDHVSAYSLIVEDGTAMARKVRKGELPAPDEDVYADRYAMIDARLQQAGFEWYEVSNWAKPGGQCEHNLLYWRDGDWWGAGPGAHSHIGNERFFNVKHPATYAAQLAQGALPIQDREHLSAEQRHEEQVMLGLRIREGVPLELFNAAEREVLARYEAMDLVEVGQRVRVTQAGRLLADGIIADILTAR
ncbi:radical SAM family heme chaperone HemW [Corynebacterium pelargi]|uniref:Heme chaperone HemW n=1 Tax=Corynebacterium pelargi TaxID=1471400 RepID=A0A410W7H8_9CORY|nr:radical SAM family heme chaperone HemW [Corynebacterium pelargi]QAU51896.1 Oxygen-independent coproporphyrinogen-III oxidase 1 [Corynebacterium pelargi]GGG71634.1 coproporphyrinogen III oxidase [Corynebacterium pelargi]